MKQFFLQLATQETLRCKLQEKIHLRPSTFCSVAREVACVEHPLCNVKGFLFVIVALQVARKIASYKMPFSLARLPTETAQVFFSESFSKRNSFIFFLPASRTCSMPRLDSFVSYLLPSLLKCYLNSQNFPPLKTAEAKTL